MADIFPSWPDLFGPPMNANLDPMVAADASIAVYMMSNRKHGTLYIGVTSQFLRRVSQHREGLMGGFTKIHGLKRLVWFAPHENMRAAIHHEKRLKKYKREWKINLIEHDNPNWDDLWLALVGDDRVHRWPEQVSPLRGSSGG
jgi:putative endonuclease